MISNLQVGGRLHFMACSQSFQGGVRMAGSTLVFRKFLCCVWGRQRLTNLWLALLVCTGSLVAARAQESRYFITYDHHMEEPGSLEIEFELTTARASGGNRFFSGLTEFEYGTTAWWTTEVYLEGQSTLNDSTIFSGYRVENRFRLLGGDHWINPVLYAEYENISA